MMKHDDLEFTCRTESTPARLRYSIGLEFEVKLKR